MSTTPVTEEAPSKMNAGGGCDHGLGGAAAERRGSGGGHGGGVSGSSRSTSSARTGSAHSRGEGPAGGVSHGRRYRERAARPWSTGLDLEAVNKAIDFGDDALD